MKLSKGFRKEKQKDWAREVSRNSLKSEEHQSARFWSFALWKEI